MITAELIETLAALDVDGTSRVVREGRDGYWYDIEVSVREIFTEILVKAACRNKGGEEVIAIT